MLRLTAGSLVTAAIGAPLVIAATGTLAASANAAIYRADISARTIAAANSDGTAIEPNFIRDRGSR